MSFIPYLSTYLLFSDILDNWHNKDADDSAEEDVQIPIGKNGTCSFCGEKCNKSGRRCR
jgi:hypothetical protein